MYYQLVFPNVLIEKTALSVLTLSNWHSETKGETKQIKIEK